MTARMVNQNLPHKLSSDGKKMSTILPVRQVLFSQTHVCLVNECGALQGMIGTFPLKVAAGDAVQFAVNEWHQRVERGLVSVTPTDE